MPLDLNVKICGVTRQQDVSSVAAAGARYIGLNFFPKSPRYVTCVQASELASAAPEGMCKVALVVDPTDEVIDDIVRQVPVDMLQLHGKETPERVRDIKSRTGLPIMKAVGVATAEDLHALAIYSAVADQLLVDTKPPKDAKLPGGNGIAFDWGLISDIQWTVPWMLAGGLTADTVGEAVRISGARQLDLSSAVETSPGVKDADLISGFCAAARMALTREAA